MDWPAARAFLSSISRLRRWFTGPTFLPTVNPVRTDQTFFTAPDGEVYVLMSRAILRMDPATLAPEVVAVPPCNVTAAGALVDGVLYFAGGVSVWSVPLASNTRGHAPASH